jgi:hypothetical protein
MLGGAVFSTVSGAMHALPIPGTSLLSFPLAAKASKLATDVVFGKLGAAAGESAKKAAAAIQMVVGGAKAATASAPALATTFLKKVRYAPSEKMTKSERAAQSSDLAGLFKARTDEIKRQTQYDQNGNSVMRPEVREALAAKFNPIRAVGQQGAVLADRLETIAARRIEYLSSVMPRRPDIGGVPTGPDNWRPSDMEMRSWARKAHAIEDPGGVEVRAATGTVSPEDIEAYRAVYPERAAAFTAQVLAQLPTLKKPLPYEKRLALTMLTGVSIEPSLDPQVLSVLQGTYAGEDGSEGGSQAPRAQPQFGSVRADIGTPSQQREQAIR